MYRCIDARLLRAVEKTKTIKKMLPRLPLHSSVAHIAIFQAQCTSTSMKTISHILKISPDTQSLYAVLTVHQLKATQRDL